MILNQTSDPHTVRDRRRQSWGPSSTGSCSSLHLVFRTAVHGVVDALYADQSVPLEQTGDPDIL
jgi:hypothetical protein